MGYPNGLECDAHDERYTQLLLLGITETVYNHSI
jgi:hypothetical protein